MNVSAVSHYTSYVSQNVTGDHDNDKLHPDHDADDQGAAGGATVQKSPQTMKMEQSIQSHLGQNLNFYA